VEPTCLPPPTSNKKNPKTNHALKCWTTLQDQGHALNLKGQGSNRNVFCHQKLEDIG